MTPLCKDCRHLMPADHEIDCRCFKVSRLSLVTGERQHQFCDMLRRIDAGAGCGPDGKLFEPKLEVA